MDLEGEASVATVKYNSSGDSQWVKVYSGGGIPGANRIAKIQMDGQIIFIFYQSDIIKLPVMML